MLFREEVRHFPEKYASLIQNNQTLPAAKLLVATYNQVTSAELHHIGALSAINMRIIREVRFHSPLKLTLTEGTKLPSTSGSFV